MEDESFLSPYSVRLVCIALIADYQARLISNGAMSPSADIRTVLRREKKLEDGDVDISDEHLQIDSLRLLDLVAEVAQFFNLSETGTEDYLVLDRALSAWTDHIVRHLRLMGLHAKITFKTSGTTGAPKSVTHEANFLSREVAATISVLPDFFKDKTQAVTLVSTHHIFGFIWAILIPQYLEIQAKDLFKIPFSSTLKSLSTKTILITTPYMLQKVLEGAQGREMIGSAVCSGERMPKSLRKLLIANDQFEIIEVYGSTETGGLGLRRFGESNFCLLPHLKCKEGNVSPQEGFSALKLQDTLIWSNNNQFFVGERSDGSIQIAGTNVSLAKIRDDLEACEAVSRSEVELVDGKISVTIYSRSPYLGNQHDDWNRAIKALPSTVRPRKVHWVHIES